MVHSERPEQITSGKDLDSLLIDRQKGLYMALSGTPGPDIPVQKKVVCGNKSTINCVHQQIHLQMGNFSHISRNMFIG